MRRRLPLPVVAVGVALAAGGAVVLAGRLIDDSEPAVVPGAAQPGELLVFASNRDGDSDIYTIAADGTRLRKLTASRADDFDPVWSPDGRRIAFVSDRDGDAEIFVMNADGSGVRQLTRNAGRDGEPAPWDTAPSWSPDGERIVFAGSRGGQRDIYVMRTDGTELTRLTWRRQRWDENFTPVWSPDGATIVFVSNRDGFFNLELYAITPEGSAMRRLTRSPETFQRPRDESMPSWSPDGRKLVFVSNRDGNSELYVMNADGSRTRRLTRRLETADLRPRWSHDGRRIAFTSTTVSAVDVIYLFDVGRGTFRRLVEGTSPDWRPHG